MPVSEKKLLKNFINAGTRGSGYSVWILETELYQLPMPFKHLQKCTLNSQRVCGYRIQVSMNAETATPPLGGYFVSNPAGNSVNIDNIFVYLNTSLIIR